jgi:P-type conjugative transfer protein TrbJ
MKTKPKILAAKIALALATMSMSVNAGIPVFDGSNLTQNANTAIQSTLSAIENVAQTLKQIEEYATQLQQFQNQIQNTLAPAAYIWDQAQSTINGLMSTIDTLNYYKNQVGSLDSYLSKFQDVAYYRNSPCFSNDGCSDAEFAAMSENRRLASESQKKANDALFRGLDKQQDALQADARTLERLQSSAQSATGRMQAIQYANQLASQQANQLLQIRGLLIAQQNAIATRMQAEADKEAMTAAADEQFRSGTFRASTGRTW